MSFIALPNHENIVYNDPDFKISVSKKKSVGYAENFHEELEIKYCYEGVTAMMIDNEAYVAEAGDILVVNPYEIHTNVDIGADNGRYYLVIIDLDFFMKSAPLGLDLRHIFFSDGERIKNIIKGSRELSSLIVRIYDEMTAGRDNYKVMVYCLACELMTTLLREYKNVGKLPVGMAPSGKGAQLIAPALARIFEGYAEPITVDELAELCGFSKYHFCRVFKRTMNVTAVEYINNYRLSVAEIMMKNGDFSTEKIAVSCGFNDVSYFYRCYKKIKNKPFKRSNFKRTE